METTALNYKLIKKVKDERFDEDLIHQYYLLIHLGTRDLQVAVMDPQENRILILEDYVFPSLGSHEEHLRLVDQLFDAHAFLKAAFWKEIRISIKNNKFVQVPEALFIEEVKAEYLKFNANVDEDREVVLSVSSTASKAVTVFAMSKDLRQWFISLYPNAKVKFQHQSAVLIEGITEIASAQQKSPLYIYVDRFKLHILAFNQGKLLYYNQFTIKQFSDYIKYIMLVMKSLNLNQKTSQVALWGYIGKNSPHYHEFYKYINNVFFGDRPNHLQFGYMFDEVQDHHFFDLYSMNLISND